MKADIKISLGSLSSVSPPASNTHLSDDSGFPIKSQASFPQQQETVSASFATLEVLFSNFAKNLQRA